MRLLPRFSFPTRPKPSSRPMSVVIEMVEPGAFGDGFGLSRVDISSDDPFRRQNQLFRVCGSSRDAMRRGHRPWAHTADAIPRGLRVLRGVGYGSRGVGYGPRYISEWCGQGLAAIGQLPIAKLIAKTSGDEETAMVRVVNRARSVLIKRDRVSISRAFRKASAGRNRCTDERDVPSWNTAAWCCLSCRLPAAACSLLSPREISPPPQASLSRIATAIC